MCSILRAILRLHIGTESPLPHGVYWPLLPCVAQFCWAIERGSQEDCLSCRLVVSSSCRRFEEIQRSRHGLIMSPQASQFLPNPWALCRSQRGPRTTSKGFLRWRGSTAPPRSARFSSLKDCDASYSMTYAARSLRCPSRRRWLPSAVQSLDLAVLADQPHTRTRRTRQPCPS